MAQYFVGPCPESATAFLYSSYIKSLWDMGGMKAQLRYGEFCDVAHKRLEVLLASKPILLALSARETPDWIGGWLIAHKRDDALYVHWVHVKHNWRKQGWAVTLLNAALEEAGEPRKIYATHDHPRWREKIAKMGIERAPLSVLRETA